jgi:hypothetical protein
MEVRNEYALFHSHCSFVGGAKPTGVCVAIAATVSDDGLLYRDLNRAEHAFECRTELIEG